MAAAIAVLSLPMGFAGVLRLSLVLERVTVLDQALRNHNDADAFMDDVRTDVLRALQATSGTDKEGENFIRGELKHHFDVIKTAVAENNTLPLGRKIGDGYAKIEKLVDPFVDGGQVAVDLALRDPVAGAANFEHFRHGFSELEEVMDRDPVPRSGVADGGGHCGHRVEPGRSGCEVWQSDDGIIADRGDAFQRHVA